MVLKSVQFRVENLTNLRIGIADIGEKTLRKRAQYKYKEYIWGSEKCHSVLNF